MRTNIKNILVPVDLSETTLNALHTAIQMTRRHNAVLHLLHIRDLMDFYPQMGQLAFTASIMDEVWDKEQALFEKMILAIRRSHQVECHLYTETANRLSAITQFSENLNAEIIVLGADPDLDQQSYLTDTLPYKLLKNAKSHVLIIPAHSEVSTFDKILFSVLGHEHPAEKLVSSLCIIERNNAEVLVLDMIGKDDIDLLCSLRTFAERIKDRLKMITALVSRRSVFSVNVVRALVGIAQDQGAQLIVMEADTRRNLKEFFFGNLTQRVLRNAKVAVLLLKRSTENIGDHTSAFNQQAGSLQLNL